MALSIKESSNGWRVAPLYWFTAWALEKEYPIARDCKGCQSVDFILSGGLKLTKHGDCFFFFFFLSFGLSLD